jgi:hypothetical protein
MVLRCRLCGPYGHSYRNRHFHVAGVPITYIANGHTMAQREPVQDTIDRVVKHIAGCEDARVVLLRNREVVHWMFGDTSFLGVPEQKGKVAYEKKLSEAENAWGRRTLKTRRPDLDLKSQWTGPFGEHICQEMFVLSGTDASKPKTREGFKPDLETADAIIEVKTQTFWTEGTAGEKILGCPFKYADIPEMYSKPLKIVCIGGAEKDCREQYGNLPGAKCTAQKKEFIEFYAEKRIEYVGATDMLIDLCGSQ